jgi:hypothetical protein
MSDKLCLDSICDRHESQTSLAIPSLPEIYPCLSILHHHTPGQISSGSLHFSFLEKINTLEYSWVKATTVSVRLRIYLLLYSIPTSFMAPLLGINLVATLVSINKELTKERGHVNQLLQWENDELKGI